MKQLILSLIILLNIVSSASCAITHKFGPYFGKVVNSQTKAPIEGAAVLVVFYTEQAGPAGSIAHYADAMETLTDSNGEFRLPANRVTNFKFLHSWDPHGYFTIFKPGYGHYPESEGVKPMFVPNGTLPENHKVVIELPKLNTREEIIKYGSPRVRSYIPFEKQKQYINLINERRETLGLDGRYSPSSFKVE